MDTKYTVQWKKLSIEGLVIVVSILLAFWIDASWDRHSQRQEEEVYLDILETALADVEDWVNESVSTAVALRSSTRRLLEAANDPAVQLSDADLDLLLNDLTWYVGNSAPPELINVLSESTVDYVEDHDLAHKLRSLGAHLGELNEVSRHGQDFYFGELLPYLQEHANLLQLNNLTGAQPGTDLEYPTFHVPVSSPISHQALLDDPRFQNLLMRQDWRLTEIIEWREAVYRGGEGSDVAAVRAALQEYRQR